MSDSPDDLPKLVNQPIVDMVDSKILSKRARKDHSRLKDLLEFVQTEFDRLKNEKLQAQQVAQNPQQSAKRRKGLVWPQKKS